MNPEKKEESVMKFNPAQLKDTLLLILYLVMAAMTPIIASGIISGIHPIG